MKLPGRLALLFLLGACSRGPAPLLEEPPRTPVAPPPPTVPPPPYVPPDPGSTRAVHDRDYLPAAVLAIQAATTRIRMAEFLLYDGGSVDDVLDALAEAAGRGVQVQVLADEEGDETELVLGWLAGRGVETQLDSPDRTLHNKLLIADDLVLVGSHNLTSSALGSNREGSLLVADAEVAGWYAAWFDAVWLAPADDPDLAPLDRTDHVPVADRDVLDALLTCITSAETDVDLVMYAMAWNDAYPGSEVDQVMSALEEAHTRGVQVDVVLDGSGWIVDNGINDAAVARLQLAGVPVWRTPASITTHAKVLRCDDTLVVGDANWSYSGLALMHGTSLLTRDPGLVAETSVWMASIQGTATAF